MTRFYDKVTVAYKLVDIKRKHWLLMLLTGFMILTPLGACNLEWSQDVPPLVRCVS